MPSGIYKRTNLAENHPNWKGDKVGLQALHEWMTKKIPKPKVCHDCKKTPPLDLANISQKYKRELSDWEWLCRSCHMTKDGRLKKFLINGANATRGVSWTKERKLKLSITNKTGKYFMCLFCSKEFYRSNCRVKVGSIKFCSQECHYASR